MKKGIRCAEVRCLELESPKRMRVQVGCRSGAGRVRVGHRGHHTGIREAGLGPERAPSSRHLGLRHAGRETWDFAESETEGTYCSF